MMYLSLAKTLVQVEELILKHHQQQVMQGFSFLEEKSDYLKALEEYRDHIVESISKYHEATKYGRL